jgi:hypothetical protein
MYFSMRKCKQGVSGTLKKSTREKHSIFFSLERTAHALLAFAHKKHITIKEAPRAAFCELLDPSSFATTKDLEQNV